MPHRVSPISTPSRTPSPDTLDQPRILCLHGGGVTAAIFRAQARELIRALPDFRLVFVDAPFVSEPGPGIIPVYQSWGPFRRWIRWKHSHPDIGDAATVKAIYDSLEKAKAADAGTGPWVGLLGFSQGAKIAASVLYAQQLSVWRTGQAATDYRFAVLLAGRGPLLSFDEDSDSEELMRAGEMSLMEFDFKGTSKHVVRMPTIHVHGRLDEGLEWHQKMMRDYFEASNITRLVEWDGNHRVPLKPADVHKVTREIYHMAREEGVDV